MHYYPFNPSAYYLSTGHWSEARESVECEAGLLRDLAYRRLLDLYYGEEEPIPSKTRLVAIRIRMLKHEDIVASVLKEKFSLIDGVWRQNRADEEVQKYQRRAAASRANGKLGGRPKTKEEPKKTQQVPGRLQLRTRTKNQLIPPTPLMGEWFERWWVLYPKKVSKQDALKAFLQLLPDAELFATIEGAIRAQVAAGHFTNASGQVVSPNPATWLNSRRWEDELQHAPVAPGKDGPGKQWWDGRSGILAKGAELGLQAPDPGDDAAWFRFMAHVWMRLGEGPWLDESSRAYPLYKQLLDGAFDDA